jgi:hypothetical protein
MKKIVRFYITVLVIILLATTVVTTGCSCHWAPPQPYGPRVTGDGTGGAIVVYEDIGGGNQHDFYVQKISPEGNILWGEKGVLIGGGYKDYDSYHDLHIVSDGSGGALVFWYADGSHITSVDSRGHVRWQKEVRWADYMISDGAGGAISATDNSYNEGTLLVTKLDSDGGFPWGEVGVGIGIRDKYTANSLKLCSDDNGRAIIIWEEFKSEPGTEPHSPKITNYIYAQRINAEGSLPWGQEGVLLYTSSEDVSVEQLQLTTDGSGGAVATWIQALRGKLEDGTPRASLPDIYAQRVDAWGNTLWTDNGVPLETQKGGGSPYNYLVVSDGTSGTTILWGGYVEYIQKIDHDGNMKMQSGGVQVSDSSPGKVISDGSGGVIVTFSHKEAGEEKSQLYVQRIDNIGRKMWQGIGTMLTERSTYDLTRDGQGGAIIAWGIGKSTFSPEKSYVQRISAEGNLLWGDEGIRLRP